MAELPAALSRSGVLKSCTKFAKPTHVSPPKAPVVVRDMYPVRRIGQK